MTLQGHGDLVENKWLWKNQKWVFLAPGCSEVKFVAITKSMYSIPENKTGLEEGYSSLSCQWFSVPQSPIPHLGPAQGDVRAGSFKSQTKKH